MWISALHGVKTTQGNSFLEREELQNTGVFALKMVTWFTTRQASSTFQKSKNLSVSGIVCWCQIFKWREFPWDFTFGSKMAFVYHLRIGASLCIQMVMPVTIVLLCQGCKKISIRFSDGLVFLKIIIVSFQTHTFIGVK